jgi:hypothetical protein
MRLVRRLSRVRSIGFCLHWHKSHSAFLAVARMVHDHFGMHRAGVFLSRLLVLVMGPVKRAIGVNRLYLCSEAYRDRNYTDKNKDSVPHVACKFSVVAAVSAAIRCAMQAARLPLQVSNPLSPIAIRQAENGGA